MVNKYFEYISSAKLNKHLAVLSSVISVLDVFNGDFGEAFLFALIAGLEYEIYTLKAKADNMDVDGL